MKPICKFFLSVLLTLFAHNLLAQKEGYNWYFGNNAGVSFNSGSPVALTNSAMATFEGCSSISDGAGNLLFYTDGGTVYNRFHNVMPNGTSLAGSWSATQSAVIVAQPGSPNLYYIFTVPALGGGNFSYSIVDMTLAGGNGDVAIKNTIVMTGPVTEKLTGTYHANGTDVWIVIHGVSSNAYYAYLLTPSGLSAPVTTNIGTIHSGIYTYAGYMKFSADGSKFANAIYGAYNMDILDFNNATGVFSNLITFSASGIYHSYGVEFSASGKTLYLSNVDGAIGKIYQFNLTAGSAAAILASATVVYSKSVSPAYGVGALQRGPDEKIYYCENGDNWLGVINYPDSLGLACNPVDAGVNLNSGVCEAGLPNYISNIFTNTFNYIKTCTGDSTEFTISNTTGLFGVLWDFGDTATGANNYSTFFSTGHYFSSSGTYTVKLTRYFATLTDTISKTVTIYAAPNINLGNDTSFCTGTSYLLNPGAGFNSYLWQDGSTNATYNATAAGTYSVTVSNGICIAHDTITLTVNLCNVPVINLASSDTSFCEKQCINFYDLSTNNPTSWQWFFPGADSTSSTLQNPSSICYNNYGSYDVTLIACNTGGCDTLVLSNFINEYPAPAPPAISQSGDTLFSTVAVSYEWYDVNNPGVVLSTAQYFVTTQAGSYFVSITDSIGCHAPSNVLVIQGLNDLAGNTNFVIYANPSGQFITVVTLKKNASQQLSIYNVEGKLIKSVKLNEGINHIEIKDLITGVYVCKLQSDKEIKIQKVVVQH